MKKYVIVIKRQTGVRIGLHRYTQLEAFHTLKRMQKSGIKNAEVVLEAEAYGGD